MSIKCATVLGWRVPCFSLYYQMIVKAVVILLAVLVDNKKQ
jgi:predicted ABC-type sugar transport system permease subunit